MHQRRLPAAVASGACVLIGSLYSAGPVGAVFPGKPGRLVFDAYNRADAALLWDYDPSTRETRQLTRAISRCRFHTNSADDWWSDRAPDYSPDGRLLAYIHGDSCPGHEDREGIWVARADGSSPRIVARPASDGVFPLELALSPDGRRMAVFGTSSIINQNVQLVYDARTGALLHRRNWDMRRIPSPAGIDWAADGALVAATSDGIRRLLPRGALAERLSFPPPDKPAFFFFASDDEPDWSPSGRTIAFRRIIQRGIDEGASARAAQVRLRYSIWRAPRRRPRAAVRVLRSSEVLVEPVFSPDGRSIAYANADGINLVSSRGGRSRLLLRRAIEGTIDWQARP